jgi:phosphatidate cytidylyltransferase
LNNLVKRIITAVLCLILIIGCLLLGEYTYFVISFAINLIALYEFYKIITVNTISPNRYLGLASGSILFILAFLVSSGIFDEKLYLVMIPLLLAVFIFELFRKRVNPAANIAITILGIVYISLPLSILNYLVFPAGGTSEYSYRILLAFLILIWTNDTAAYFSGMAAGRHMLFKRISPKKTWEGFIGGMLFTFIAAWALSGFFDDLNLTDMLVFAGIVSLIGVAGDLTESMFKRSIKVKDAGNILPGHGGILDRIDSILMTSPLIFIYLELFK